MATITIGLVVQLITTAVLIIALEEAGRAVSRRAAKRAGAGPTVIRDLGVVLRAGAVIAIVTNVLSATGIASEFTALTVSGIAALAVSLALQTTLSNVISGVLLFNDGAIRLNDSIEFSGIKGKVVRVALRNTWIKMETGTLVIVSNSSLSTGPLANHTATERLMKRYSIE